MKKINRIIYAAVLLSVVVLGSSCKKETEPGPAGANGTNGSNGALFPYKQVGTSLNLEGTFNSDNAAFDNLLELPFFSVLEESSLTESSPLVRTEGTLRTSADGVNQYFSITRYDSLGNNVLNFEIENDYSGDIYINSLYFNVKLNVDETSYKKVYTTAGGGGFRTSGPYDDQGALEWYTLENYGNSFEITNWNYNSTTKVLSFDYNGLLTGDYNSTGNDLTVSGTVTANVKKESLRQGK